MKKAFELRQQRAKLIHDAGAIIAAAETENRSLNSDEEGRHVQLLEQAAGLEKRAKTLESQAALDAEIRNSGSRDLGEPLPHEVEKRHSYSVMKALRQQLAAREGKGKLDGLELETHQELEKRRGRASQGVMIPLLLPFDPAHDRVEHRALDTTAGTGTIPTILAASMIDILRNRLAVAQMGATILEDMQGLFAIPRQNAKATGYWVAEGGTVTGSNQTADQVSFSPKTVGAFTDYTRRFLEQTNQSAERFVRNDLTAVVARGVDLAAVAGTGSSNQPLGITANSGIGTTAIGTNGGAPTWASIVALESAVAVANADMGNLGYLTNASVRGKMKTTVKDSNTFGIYLWGSDNTLNGYKAAVSNQVPNNLTKGTASGVCSAMIFGNWADLIIAYWSGLDVLVDPYTGGNAGTIRIITLQDADVNVRHPESFQKILDYTTT